MNFDDRDAWMHALKDAGPEVADAVYRRVTAEFGTEIADLRSRMLDRTRAVLAEEVAAKMPTGGNA